MAQPLGSVEINYSNPITQNLVFSMQAGSDVNELVTDRTLSTRGTSQTITTFLGELAYDNRTTNATALINVYGAAGGLLSDQTIVMDVVVPGAYTGTVPAIGGLWRSTTQNDAYLVIERNGTNTLQVATRVGASATFITRSFDIGLSSLYGKRLTIAASVARGLNTQKVYLKVATEGAILYELEQTYSASGNADVSASGTEYLSLGSEPVENPTRNPNCLIYSQHHFGRLLTTADVLSLHQQPYQMYSQAGSPASVTYSGTGGIILSGAPYVNRQVFRQMSGGATFGGASSVTSGMGSKQSVVIPSGGLVLLGTTSLNKSTSRTANASLGFGGAATIMRAIGGAMEFLGTLGDRMFAKLRWFGKLGSLSDMLDENKHWRELAGGSDKPLNDVKKQVLQGLGKTGALNDMENGYWRNSE